MNTASCPVVVANFFDRWSRESFFCTCSVCAPTDVLARLPVWFPDGEQLGEDQDLWFRIAEQHLAVHKSLPLVLYRVGNSQSLTGADESAELLPCYERLAQRLSQPDFPLHQRRGARRLVASHYINVARAKRRAGQYAQAWQLLLHPRSLSNPLYWLRAIFGVAA